MWVGGCGVGDAKAVDHLLLGDGHARHVVAAPLDRAGELVRRVRERAELLLQRNLKRREARKWVERE